MAIKLIVIESFDGYAKGDEISDPATVAAILEGDSQAHVLSVQALDAPAE